MALRLRTCIYIHIPKTGGTWVTKLLQKEGRVLEIANPTHLTLTELLEDPAYAGWEGLPAFTFLRHPLSWYKSYFAYRTRFGWAKGSGLDRDCWNADFSTFVLRASEQHPGYLGDSYGRFVKGIDYVRPFETLRESLIEILGLVGETLPESAIYAFGKINHTKSHECQYTSTALKALLVSEKKAVELWRSSS